MIFNLKWGETFSGFNVKFACTMRCEYDTLLRVNIFFHKMFVPNCSFFGELFRAASNKHWMLTNTIHFCCSFEFEIQISSKNYNVNDGPQPRRTTVWQVNHKLMFVSIKILVDLNHLTFAPQLIFEWLEEKLTLSRNAVSLKNIPLCSRTFNGI